jgi:hypothetical protein
MSYQTIRPFKFYGRMHQRGEKFAAEGADPRRVQQLIEARFITWVEDPPPEKRGPGRPKGSKTAKKKTSKKVSKKTGAKRKPPSDAAEQARAAREAEEGPVEPEAPEADTEPSDGAEAPADADAGSDADDSKKGK